MKQKIRLMSPGPNGQIINEFGKPEQPPQNWIFLPSGDAAITRKVTTQSPVWRIQVKKGRRIQSIGIWAPEAIILAVKKEVTLLRATPEYAKKRKSAVRSRDKKQAAYEIEFKQEIIKYLKFHQDHRSIENTMAQLITEHAIPVGSGTVARTAMIPIEERAAKAVIAWMRHQTTGYDQMKIARIKGERRAVRRQLAERSVELLKAYRRGYEISPNCPLKQAIMKSDDKKA